MGSVDEETIKASLARINAALQSVGSPKVFEQYQHGYWWRIRLGRREPGIIPPQGTPILPKLRPIERHPEFATSVNMACT